MLSIAFLKALLTKTDYRTGCRNVSHFNNNSRIQDYVHPDDQTQPTFESTPGFKPFTKTVIVKTIRDLSSGRASTNQTFFAGEN